MSNRMVLLLAFLCAATAPGVVSTAAAQAPASDAGKWEVPRTPDGHPDLQGNWTNSTLTRFERGEGEGLGYNINLPMPHGSSEEDFFAKLDEAVAAIRLYQPDVLILTLGFDIYKNDPQAKVSVTSEGFCRLSTHLRQLGLPTLVVQEGGYDLDALSENVQQFFKGLEG